MFKREYFLMAMKANLYMHKRWILEAFSVTRSSGNHDYPFGLVTMEDGRYAFIDKNNDAGYQIIEDAMPGEPLFRPLEKLILKAGDLENVRQTTVTTYGNGLYNQMVLIYPFGNKIDFMTGRIDPGKIEKEIQARWDDNAEDVDGMEPNKRPIRTKEFKRFGEAVGQTTGLAQLCVPSASPKTMTADPAMIKRRDELLKQHKDELHDPVVLSKIMAELIKMDKEWMKGDPGERFYFKAKSYDVVRMKVFIMQGISTGFGLAGELVPTSLDEGWDISKLPAQINQLRDGSYGRGAQTALGGVEVKFNNRIFQNSTVAEDDCGSKRGVSTRITRDKIPHYIGNYQLIKDKPVVLTEESLKAQLGETIEVRSPLYCRTGGANFCAKCMGDGIASTPQALSTYAASIGSLLMDVFMKLMHGKSLTTETLDVYGSLT